MIRYRCSSCNAILESPKSLAEKEDICPVCKCMNVVPGEAASSPTGGRRVRRLIKITSVAVLGTIVCLAIGSWLGMHMLRSQNHRLSDNGSAILPERPKPVPLRIIVEKPQVSSRPIAERNSIEPTLELPTHESMEIPESFADNLEPDTKNRTSSTEDLFRKAAPAVVRIVAKRKNPLESGFGSGFFIDSDGSLVTNYHVIEGSEEAYVQLDNGMRLPIEGALATDPQGDIALLKVTGSGFSCLSIHKGDMPEVGAKIYTIGNPAGLTNTLSEGLISGYRKVSDFTLLQTTAAISPGSSGGPLLTTKGEVIGVMSYSFAKGQNLNFAVPIERVNKLLRSRGPLRTLVAAAAEPGPLAQERKAKELEAVRRKAAVKNVTDQMIHKLEEADKRFTSRRAAEASRAREERLAEERRRKEALQTKHKRDKIVAVEKELKAVTASLNTTKANGRVTVQTKQKLSQQYELERQKVKEAYEARLRHIQKLYRQELPSAGLIYFDPAEFERQMAEAKRRRSERRLSAQNWQTNQYREIDQRYQPQITAVDFTILKLEEEVRTLMRRQKKLRGELMQLVSPPRTSRQSRRNSRQRR